MKVVISTGTSVMDRREAQTIAKVLVKASGRNIRPSWASSRNRLADGFELRFHVVNHAESVFAETHDDDPAHDFAFAVELGHAAPDVRAQPDLRDIADADRSAARIGPERHALDVRQRREI